MGKGLKNAHHGQGDRRLLDKFNDAGPRPSLFAIKTKDETSHDLQAGSGDGLHSLHQGGAHVLVFLGHKQAGLIRGFNAKKDPPKTTGHHQLHQGLIGS
jgi:hypothetical protein